MDTQTDSRSAADAETDAEDSATTKYAIVNENPFPSKRGQPMVIVNRLLMTDDEEPSDYGPDGDQSVDGSISGKFAIFADKSEAERHLAAYQADGNHDHLSLFQMETEKIADTVAVEDVEEQDDEE